MKTYIFKFKFGGREFSARVMAYTLDKARDYAKRMVSSFGGLLIDVHGWEEF